MNTRVIKNILKIMKKYNFRKLLLILPILGLFLFQNCTKEEEIIENEPELITPDVNSLQTDLKGRESLNNRTEIEFSRSNNVRGWSWDGGRASYLVVKGGKTYLYLRSFFGYTFGPHREIFMSSSDNMRSWNWDGQTASYHVVKGGKTYLYIRPFDGYKFGPHREVVFSSSDNVRGWFWSKPNDQKVRVCSYLVVKNGGTYTYTRPYNGVTFGTHEEEFFSYGDNIKGWSPLGIPRSNNTVNVEPLFKVNLPSFIVFYNSPSDKSILILENLSR